MDIEVWIDGAKGTAKLGSPLGAVEVAELVADWTPYLADQPDAKWDWEVALRDHPHGERYCQVGLWAYGRLQGAMIIERAVTFRSDGLFGNAPRILYLASAPWSRSDSNDQRYPRVTPVGYLMLLVAVAISHRDGGEGRLSWHSEPEIEWWYNKNVRDLARFEKDWDGERHLTLFELGTRAADLFREACRERGVAEVPGVDFDHV